MLNSIKLRIQNYVCESHDNCALTYVLKAKEESDKKLSILQHKEEGIDCLNKLISADNQAAYINISNNSNDIIFIKISYDGIQIKDVDLIGYFGITPFERQNNRQIVNTEIRFDSNGILRCYIVDFLCFGSHGYGSVMMSVLKEYLKTIPVAYISGRLSTVDTEDSNDPEHNDRLHHFYKKHGFSFIKAEGCEYIKYVMNSSKLCSKDYIEHTKYLFEISGYEDNIFRLLIERKITMKDLDRAIRISNPNFYLHGLRASVSNVGSMLQTLELLSGDIDSIAEEDNVLKKALIEKLLSYIDPLRYHCDNEDLIKFSQNAIQKYKQSV